MQKFIGVKLVQAEPMKAEEAISKGYLRVKDSYPNTQQDGYHVVYQDGYNSWCPKEVFDKQYFGVSSEKVTEIDTQNLISRMGLKPSGDTIEDEACLVSHVYDSLQFVVDWAINGLNNE